MASAILRMPTSNRKGPIRLQVSFSPRCEGDFFCYIHCTKDVNEESFKWKFNTALKMLLYPKRTFDPKLMTKNQIQQGTLPDYN